MSPWPECDDRQRAYGVNAVHCPDQVEFHILIILWNTATIDPEVTVVQGQRNRDGSVLEAWVAARASRLRGKILAAPPFSAQT